MKKNKIEFSVLMSVYYKEKKEYLKKSLDSVIRQTVVPNEIVIVKDGPLNEDVDNLLNYYENKYSFIKTVSLEKNCGLGIALNYGMKFCSYSYIARMDTDDICFNDRFEKQLNFLAANPDVDVLGGSIVEFDNSTGLDVSVKKVPSSYYEVKKYVKRRNPLNHMTVMFKKRSVLECGGYQNCPLFEDYYLWARMISKNKVICNLDDNLVRVRAGIEMSNRRGSIKYAGFIINFEKKLLKLEVINLRYFIENILIRTIISIIPNKLRYNFYQRRLRNAKN